MGIAVLVGGGRLLERCACVCSFSCVWLCSLMDYIASQASLSMGFPGQEYLNGLPFPPPGDLPNPGNQTFSWFSCTAGRFFTTEPPGKPRLLPSPFLLPGEDMRCVPGEAVLLIGPRGQWYVLQTKVLDLFLVYVQILSLFLPSFSFQQNSRYVWQLILWKWQGTTLGTECARGVSSCVPGVYLSQSAGRPGSVLQWAWVSGSLQPQQRERGHSPWRLLHQELPILLPKHFQSFSSSPQSPDFVFVVRLLGHISFAIPWTVAHQAPLSIGFPKQEYWSGLPFPPPGDLPDPVMEPVSPALACGFFITEPSGKPQILFSFYQTNNLLIISQECKDTHQIGRSQGYQTKHGATYFQSSC